MTRGGVLGMLAELQARSRGRGDEAAGSRRNGGERASPTGPAPGTACRLGAIKASGGVEEQGGCSSGDAAALAEGTLKDHRQEGNQHSRNHEDAVLTRRRRCTSSASTAHRYRCCHSGIPSSCGAPRSPHKADRSAGHGGRYEVQREKHLKG